MIASAHACICITSAVTSHILGPLLVVVLRRPKEWDNGDNMRTMGITFGQRGEEDWENFRSMQTGKTGSAQMENQHGNLHAIANKAAASYLTAGSLIFDCGKPHI